MSAVAESAAGAAPSAARTDERVTQGNVLRSEWTKLWSLRSTRWSLLAAVVAMAGLGMLIAAVRIGHEHRAFDPINNGVAGYHLAQLAIGVLGVLVISGEYATGMIRSSFMAVPHRLPVLWAKALVFAAVTFALMLVSSFVSFFGVQAILSQNHNQASLSDPHALRVVVGTALFLTILGVLAVGIGGLVRSTAGGIAVFVGLLFVLPGITALLPSSVGDSITPYLPINAGLAVATSTFDNTHHLAPWAGFAVFCGYAAIAMAAAAAGLIRRDA
ncbi:MAG: ABC transporter permease [Actinomycetota bacterium]|nr:ABC transporter permease [Actinomycetota bacterium]